MARLYKLDNSEPIKGEQLRRLALDAFKDEIYEFGKVARPNTVGKAVWFFTHKFNRAIYTRLESEPEIAWIRIYEK